MIGGLLSFNASELIVEIAFVSAFWQKKENIQFICFFRIIVGVCPEQRKFRRERNPGIGNQDFG